MPSMSDELAHVMGALAHDLNNLLTVLKGYPELLLLRPDLDPDVRRRLESMLRAATKATEYVQQVSALGGRIASRCQELNLCPALHTAVAEAQAASPAPRVELELAEDELPVVADPQRLSWVLAEVLSVAREREPELVRARAARDEGRVVVQLVDHGPVLDPAEPFRPYRYKRRERARGLGLAAAATLMAQWGGAAEVKSEATSTTWTLAFRPSGGAT